MQPPNAPTKAVQEAAKKAPTPKRFFTRLEAAKSCGVTLNQWMGFEKRGMVRAIPVAEAHGWVEPVKSGRRAQLVVRAEDVARIKDDSHVKRLTSGQIAAATFELLRSGLSPAEVVIRLRLSPERVEELVRAYARLNDSLLVPASILQQLKTMGWRDVTQDNFVAAIERLLATLRAVRAGKT